MPRDWKKYRFSQWYQGKHFHTNSCLLLPQCFAKVGYVQGGWENILRDASCHDVKWLPVDWCQNEESCALCEKGRCGVEKSPGGKTRPPELGSREQLQETRMQERKNTQLWCAMTVFWAQHLQMRTQHGGVKQKHDTFVQESKLVSSQLIIIRGYNTPVKTKERNIPS